MTPNTATAVASRERRPDRVGPFEVSNEECVRRLTIHAGGNPEFFGDSYLALGLAMRALHGALEIMGVGPALGPAPAMLVLPHPVFCKLRDALVAEGKGGDHMFKRPRRKRVDPNRLVTMLGGITIASDLAAGTVDLSAPRCPMRAAPAPAPTPIREEWFMCHHPAWPDPLPAGSSAREAIGTLERNPHPDAWLLRTVRGGRVEYRGDALAQLRAAA